MLNKAPIMFFSALFFWLTSPKPQTYLYRQGPMQKEQMIHWASSSSDVLLIAANPTPMKDIY